MEVRITAEDFSRFKEIARNSLDAHKLNLDAVFTVEYREEIDGELYIWNRTFLNAQKATPTKQEWELALTALEMNMPTSWLYDIVEKDQHVNVLGLLAERDRAYADSFLLELLKGITASRFTPTGAVEGERGGFRSFKITTPSRQLLVTCLFYDSGS